MPGIQLFLSAVTEEFRSYRDSLRTKLQRPNVTVHVQEDFIATGTETLDKLDSYIKQCDAVIHIFGGRTGAFPPTTALSHLKERYPDFGSRLPILAEAIDTGSPAISYTQWEAYLAVYHKKVLLIAAAESDAPRDTMLSIDEGHHAEQENHRQRLMQLGRHVEIRFRNRDQLIADISLSSVLDLLVKASGRGKRDTIFSNPNVRRFIARVSCMIGGSVAALLSLTLGIVVHFWISGRPFDASVGKFGVFVVHCVVLLVGAVAGLVYDMRKQKRRLGTDVLTVT